MKDLLSEVLLRKRFCVENCTTESEVFTAFKGLLAVLGKATAQSSVQIVANALSDSILKHSTAIAAKGALHTTDIGEVNADTGKSGKLDKVNDDCLRMAVGYLSAKDRMENVEVSCRRLFHLSRSVHYGIDEFGTAVELFNVAQSRIVEFARRMRCTELRLYREPFRSMDAAIVMDITNVLRPRIRTLYLHSRFTQVLRLSFPLLKNFNGFTISPQSFCEFVKRHRTLNVVGLPEPVTVEMLELCCAPNQVQSMNYMSIDRITLNAAIQRNLNLRKFAGVSFHQCNDFSLVKPFLHKHTQTFWVWVSYNDATIHSKVTHLPNLTYLRLRIGNTAAISLRNLNLKTSAKMECIECTASLLDLDECLRLCPFGTVQMTAVTDFCTVLQSAQLFKRLLAIFGETTKYKHKAVAITLKETTTDEGLAIARDFAQFLVVHEDILRLTPISVTVTATIDGHLQRALGRDMMAIVKNAVRYVVK